MIMIYWHWNGHAEGNGAEDVQLKGFVGLLCCPLPDASANKIINNPIFRTIARLLTEKFHPFPPYSSGKWLIYSVVPNRVE